MNEMRRITQKYYLRQIVACWLVFYMLFCFGIPLRVATADQNPGAGTLPSGLINSTGVNAPIVDDILHTMDITQTAGEAIMNWNNFDIGSGAKVEFIQQLGPTSAVLNRIHDGSPTGIMGTLQANGRVFIINPAGVLFGEGATVNVAQLVASHLNIADGVFLGGGDFEFNIDNMEEFLDINPDYLATVTGDGAIINHGTIGNEIKTEGVILLGKRILNTGTIKTKSGGFVAMAAGDRVLLGEPGSKIIVEMTSVQNPQGDDGHVINSETGEITAPEGQIVLAAGDIFSLGTVLDTEPVKVLFGNGSVEQSGTISADGITGDGGTVTLTSADETVLGPESMTTANAGTDSEAGRIVVHSVDRTEIRATAETGAEIQAIGGHELEQVEDSLAPLFLIEEPSVEIIGDTINLAGDIDASATDITKKGKILIEADNLTIANGSPDDPLDNTLYEKWIEGQSAAKTDLELVAHSMNYEPIIIIKEIDDGEITGGSGDIYLRTKFDKGGISFVNPLSPDSYEPATIRTEDGGNIFMVAGNWGIIAGDLITDTQSSDRVSDPGRIRILADNGGAIDVGTMYVDKSGRIVEISAIADGDLTVNGGAVALTNTVSDDIKNIGFARICLVSVKGNVTVDGASVAGQLNAVQVFAHGKDEANADIRICAGKDVTLVNLRKNDPVKAESRVSENSPGNLAISNVTIGAGGLDEEELDPSPPSGTGQISINGVTNLQELPVAVEAGAAGSGKPLRKTPADDEDAEENTVTVDVDETKPGEFTKHVTIDIDRDFAEQPVDSEEPCPDCPCADCPTPPDFPIVPFTNPDVGKQHMGLQITIDVSENDADGLTILGFSQPSVGSVTQDSPGVFTFTPPPGFVGDATFSYVAIDGGVPITENVTITITNALPFAQDAALTIHMNTGTTEGLIAEDTPDNTPGIVTPGVIDEVFVDLLEDGGTLIGNTLTTALGGTVTLIENPDGTFSFNYTPPDGFADDSDSFSYAVTDAESVVGVNGIGLVTITMTNQLPTVGGDLGDVHMNVEVPALDLLDYAQDQPDQGIYDPLSIESMSPLIGQNGGTLAKDNGTWTYTPADGYVGPEEFTIEVWDGQYEYVGGVKGDKVLASGTLTVDMTNQLPTVGGDLGDVHMNTEVSDLDLLDYAQDQPDQGIYDPLSIESWDTTGQNGGTLAKDNGTWTYTPKDGYVGPEGFTINVWDGQYEYVGGEKGDKVLVSGTLTIDMTNQLPNVGGDLGNVHMNTEVSGLDLLDYAQDQPDQGIYDPLSIESWSMNGQNGGTLTKDNGTWTYTPKDGYVGPEGFSIEVWDGQYNYPEVGDPTRVTVTGTLTLDMTNVLPVAEDGSFSGPAGVPITGGLTYADLPDLLADIGFGATDEPLDVTLVGAVGNVLNLPSGGQVILNLDGTFTYIPPYPDYLGPDSFEFEVWDGQYNYPVEGDPTKVTVTGTVTLNFEPLPPPPVTPAIPVPVIRSPEVEGCPAVIAAAAGEIGIPKQTVQIWIGRSLASGVDIQPCDVCSRLVSTAGVLRDESGARLAALAEVINTIAPADVPFTPELGAQIATAFEQRLDEDVRYATAQEYIDALVAYVLILQDELPGIVADPIVFTMDKYGGGITEQENANIGAFVAMRLEALGG